MQANHHIDPELLDNRADFTEDFYQRFKLRRAPLPLQLNDSISKDYLFPTYYGDVSCAMAIFMCDYESARTLLPDSCMQPVRMPGKRALVAFSCYEYKKVLGVAPYNEIAMTIPILMKPKLDIPVLPMIWNSMPGFGYHVFHMPVTSLENQIRGRKIWGLPKVVDDIDIAVADQTACIEAVDEAGHAYFALKVPVTGKAQQFDVRSNLYSLLDGKILKSETCFKAEFQVNKYMNRLWSRSTQPPSGSDPGYLTIGDGPYGEMLRRLNIDPNPFQFRYASRMSACFDLPEVL